MGHGDPRSSPTTVLFLSSWRSFFFTTSTVVVATFSSPKSHSDSPENCFLRSQDPFCCLVGGMAGIWIQMAQ
ncbi:hypothetical protein SLA2020_044040 [Shorea laevis]